MNKKLLGGVAVLAIILVGGIMLYLSQADDIKEQETTSFLDQYFAELTVPERDGTTFMPSGRAEDLFISYEFDSADGKVEKNITLGPNKTVLEIKNPEKGSNKEKEIFLSDEQKDTIYTFLRNVQFDQIVTHEREEVEPAEGEEPAEPEPADEILLSVTYSLLSGTEQRFVASEGMNTYVDEEWQSQWGLARELFDGLLAIYE